jgi:glyoxylase-like metal-dependent hydrolase (beta-lactamase superfamily II)
MFVGDLIFHGSIGRTDMPLCDHTAMFASLKRIATTVPPQTHLFPGHMSQTTLAAELGTNPHLVGMTP